MLVQGWYAATPTFPPTTNVGPTYLCYLCSDPKHKIWRPLILFTNSKHTRTWVRKGGGVFWYFQTYVGPDHFGVNFLVFCDDPKRYPQNLHTPKNFHFSENPQRYWNSKFWTPKWCEPTYEWKYYSTPPLHPLLADRNRGRGASRLK